MERCLIRKLMGCLCFHRWIFFNVSRIDTEFVSIIFLFYFYRCKHWVNYLYNKVYHRYLIFSSISQFSELVKNHIMIYNQKLCMTYWLTTQLSLTSILWREDHWKSSHLPNNYSSANRSLNFWEVCLKCLQN